MIASSFCGLLGHGPDGALRPFSVEGVKIDVEIRGLAVSTIANISYSNKSKSSQTAVLVFPCIKDVGLFTWSARINGRNCLAEETYSNEEQVQVRIGNVDAQTQVDVSVEFVQQMKRDIHTDSFILDLVSMVTPRQLPHWMIGGSFEQIKQKLVLNSSQVAITDIEYTFVLNCSISLGFSGVIKRMRLLGTEEEPNVFSQGGNGSLKMSRELFRPSTDMAIVIDVADVNAPIVFAEVGTSMVKGFEKSLVTAWYEPGTVAPKMTANDTADDEFWLLLDRSGSMSGAKNEQAKRMLLLFVKSLPVKCKFNVIGFGETYEPLFDNG